MTASVLQEKWADNSGSATTITISPNTAFTAGSTVLVRVSYASVGGTTTVSVSDPTNGSYTQIQAVNDTVNEQQVLEFYKFNVAAGSPTITATLGVSKGFNSISLHELGGVTTTDPLA